jgi:DNA-binding NtrC family response regulator
VDVRIVAAPIETCSAAWRRALPGGLYYRLNVFSLHVPPLREHPSDIPLLATFFLERQAKENAKALEGFTRKP